MINNVIEISNISRNFGAIQAVDDVTLNILEGETLGLIGHNGAGKSTLFKMMLGLIPPSAGSIRIRGTSVPGNGFRALRRSIGYLPENLALYDNLSGLETLHFFASLKGCDHKQCASLLEKVGLAHAANRRVDGYSKGMRQRLGFAQALLGTPRILFLDEPTNGLDPEGIREIYKILGELNAEGVTVVITSHILSEFQQRVKRLALMKSGKLHALGSLQELRETVNLPLNIVLRMDCPLQTLQDALNGISVEKIVADGKTVTISCQRVLKMLILQRLAALGHAILDIELKEPTLEDVFLGYPG